MAWDNYQREERKFDVIPEGKYRIRIKSAEKAVSKAGNDMLALQFEVSGHTGIVFHYIVNRPNDLQRTNQDLTAFFDSFAGIKDGDFNTANWVGKTGACVIKNEEDDYGIKAKVRYFISYDKQDALPAWQEPNNGGTVTPAYSGGATAEMKEADDDDLPF